MCVMQVFQGYWIHNVILQIIIISNLLSGKHTVCECFYKISLTDSAAEYLCTCRIIVFIHSLTESDE